MPDSPLDKPRRRPRYHGSHPRAFQDKYKERNRNATRTRSPRWSRRERRRRACIARSWCRRSWRFWRRSRATSPSMRRWATADTRRRCSRPCGPADGCWRSMWTRSSCRRPKHDSARWTSRRTRCMIRRSNFAGLAGVLAKDNLPGADVVLADLGVSSMQTRRSLTRVHLQTRRSSRLAHEPAARPTGRRPARVARRGRGWRACWRPTRTNPTLRRWRRPSSSASNERPSRPRRISPRRSRPSCGTGPEDRSTNGVVDSIRRVFQALRIAVNDEFGALDAFLRLLPACVILRRTRRHRHVSLRRRSSRQAGVQGQACAPARLAASLREVVRPGADERRANPRSSAAKLRWAIRA